MYIKLKSWQNIPCHIHAANTTNRMKFAEAIGAPLFNWEWMGKYQPYPVRPFGYYAHQSLFLQEKLLMQSQAAVQLLSVVKCLYPNNIRLQIRKAH